jgi:hypothetical protein
MTTLEDLLSSALHEQPLIRAIPGPLDLLLSLTLLLVAVAALLRARPPERWRPQIDRRLIGPGMVMAGAGALVWLCRDLSTRHTRVGATLLLTLCVGVV